MYVALATSVYTHQSTFITVKYIYIEKQHEKALDDYTVCLLCASGERKRSVRGIWCLTCNFPLATFSVKVVMVTFLGDLLLLFFFFFLFLHTERIVSVCLSFL